MQDFINFKLVPALGSAFFWCIFWLSSFLLFTFTVNQLELPTTTSALIITLTVVSGHIVKLASFVSDTDTDFRRGREWRVENLLWVRIILTIGIVGILVIFLLPAAKDRLLTEFDPGSVYQLLSETWNNIEICIALFLLQVVFSWPELEILEKERSGGPS